MLTMLLISMHIINGAAVDVSKIIHFIKLHLSSYTFLICRHRLI